MGGASRGLLIAPPVPLLCPQVKCIPYKFCPETSLSCAPHVLPSTTPLPPNEIVPPAHGQSST